MILLDRWTEWPPLERPLSSLCLLAKSGIVVHRIHLVKRLLMLVSRSVFEIRAANPLRNIVTVHIPVRQVDLLLFFVLRVLPQVVGYRNLLFLWGVLSHRFRWLHHLEIQFALAFVLGADERCTWARVGSGAYDVFFDDRLLDVVLLNLVVADVVIAFD